MNAVIAFLRFNWRIIVLCALVAVIVAGIMRYDRNRGRFVPVPMTDGVGLALDTRTGRYCNPWPGNGPKLGYTFLPRCSDLAKSWW